MLQIYITAVFFEWGYEKLLDGHMTKK